MDFNGLVDKRNIRLLFGCYCNEPSLVLQNEYATISEDFVESFHKLIWGAIYNICKKGKAVKISAVEIENEISLFKTSLDVWNVNNGFEYIEDAIIETQDKIHNVGIYRDTVRKYSILRNAIFNLKLDMTFVYEEYNELDTTDYRLKEKEEKMQKFNKMTSNDLTIAIHNKYMTFKNIWNENFTDNYNFKAGDNIEERIHEHKNQENAWGYPFQSGYLTTVFRGMRPKKYMIRSSISGGGKSRSSLADAINIACNYIYDWTKHNWISTGEQSPTLFISSELTKEEVQDCLLAHISGIEQDRIEEWSNITTEEETILYQAGQVLKASKMFIEYMPDFNIDSISQTIEQYIINEHITHAFFDYINDSPSLYSYYIEKTGVRLQTHQILFLFSASLKQIANKYNIYLGSATQVSSNWKDEKDANALKGSKAIIEKADYGVLVLPASLNDIKKLNPILNGGFYSVPNMAYYIFKNRGGKWNSIIVWTKLNLGTMRELDCFVTNNDFELVNDIDKTLIEFQISDIGNASIIDSNSSIAEGGKFIKELNKVNL